MNPREHAKTVTLWSGKDLTIPTPTVVEAEKESQQVPEEASSSKDVESKKGDKEVKKPTPPTYKPPTMYP